jgi:hypothetical protein
LVQQNCIFLTRYDFDQDAEGQIWFIQYMFNIEDETVQINAMGIGIDIIFSQTDKVVSLQVTPTIPGSGKRIFNATAPSLLDLQAQHPEVARIYLAPLLIRLTGTDVLRPGATDVYRAFPEIPATPQAVQSVKALLPQLDVDSFEQREAASSELSRLGSPGILAVLRLDQAMLTQEQKARCDAFLNTQRRREIEDPDKARRDPDFLLEVLNDDDLAVRAAAQKALASLLGHTIDFDAAQTSGQRQAALGKLREQVRQELTMQPTTLQSESAGP